VFDLIAFDADDTLWENEAYYVQGRDSFHKILEAYTLPEDLDAQLDEIENRNIPYFGYGVSSFVYSLIETAIQVTGGKIHASDIRRIMDISKEMLDAKIDLFDHVEPTLRHLAKSYPLILITKGDLLHQKNKLDRSGLGEFFQHVEVVADKTCEVYAAILAQHHVEPDRFLMIGNSMRSDILPVLELGGHAAYIPSKLQWAHEHSELPEELAAHFVELEHLGQVEEWIRQADK
jgi:putative hydrolase of the HAD superfamily